MTLLRKDKHKESVLIYFGSVDKRTVSASPFVYVNKDIFNIIISFNQCTQNLKVEFIML